MIYTRPLLRFDPTVPQGAILFGDGWFDTVELLERDRPPTLVPASDAPAQALAALSASRSPIAGLDMAGGPALMGILNVTPDSFSDGGQHTGPRALDRARAMVGEGADLLDIGGESTRPGAAEVDIATEIDRTAPIIAALSGEVGVPISIDTRKAAVARAALDAGADLVNDVSGFTFDDDLAPLCAERGAPVCVMHSIGTPETMQDQARYADVILDVYDHLASRVEALVAGGISKDRIVVDPGIGFAKTQTHNLALLQRLSLFHTLGCPILLGASRKRFIGAITEEPDAQQRAIGSVAVALLAADQGAQILRIHDVRATSQALAMRQAIRRPV